MKTMTIILATYSSDEHWNGDCDFALARLDEDKAKKIMSRHKLFRDLCHNDPDLNFTEYSDFTCQYYTTGYNEFSEEFQELVDGITDYHVLPEGYDLSFLTGKYLVRTESDAISFCEIGFSWNTQLRNSNLDLSTAALPCSILSQLI